MTELIAAIEEYAIWLYALLGVLIVREFLKVWRSGQERRHAMFGLEREAATGKSTRSLVVTLLLVTIAIGIYTTARVIAPAMPEKDRRLAQDQAPILDTPMQMSIATDTPQPRPLPTPVPPRIVTSAPERLGVGEIPLDGTFCRNPDVDIVAPGPGDVLDEPAAVVVTARFEPDGAKAYRIEIGEGAEPDEWRPLLSDQREPTTNSKVLTLDVDTLEPGIYTLRLSLVGPDGATTADNACSVSVRVP